ARARRDADPRGAAPSRTDLRARGRPRPHHAGRADDEPARPRPRLGRAVAAGRPASARARDDQIPHRHHGGNAVTKDLSPMANTQPLDRRAPASPLKQFAQRLEVRMLLLALLIAVCLSFLSPFFLTKSNIFNLLDQSVV